MSASDIEWYKGDRLRIVNGITLPNTQAMQSGNLACFKTWREVFLMEQITNAENHVYFMIGKNVLVNTV